MNTDRIVELRADRVVSSMMEKEEIDWEELIKSQPEVAAFLEKLAPKDIVLYRKLFQLAYVTGYGRGMEAKP